jgi:hypothetical protein
VFMAAEGAEEPVFQQLRQLSSLDVAEVLQVARVRILRFLERRGAIAAALPVEQLELLAESGEQEPSLGALAAAAVSGQVPAGPEFRHRSPITLRQRGEVRVTGALLASDGGFTLHAATVAAAHDETGREALVRYVLRPPLAQERLTRASDDLVRLTLKRPFSDGTFAIELDPLSLLCRLVATIPPPRFHTVRYSGVLASASKLRPFIVPAAPAPKGGSRCGWRPWAELMKRVFKVDVDRCSPMKLRALVTEPANVRRYLRHLDEATELPPRAPARDPPYFKSRVVRRKVTGQVELVA